MHSLHRLLLLSLTLLASQACSDKLKLNGDDAPEVDEFENGTRSGKFTSLEDKDGSMLTRVDATSEDAWVQFDLDTGKSVSGDEDWDLAFLRSFIKTDGGASGSGNVYVAQLKEESFESVTRAPNEGFQADQPDGEEDTDSNPDNVFNSGPEDWYDYNVMNHTLAPRDITYVIASSAGDFFKFRIESYYDPAGTSGVWKVRWQQVDPPEAGFPPPGAEGDTAEAESP